MSKDIQSKRKRNKSNPWLGRFVLVIVLALLVWEAYHNASEWFISSMIKTTPAVTSVLEEKIDASSLIFVRERVVTAPYSGKIKILVQNGQRISQTQTFAQLFAFGSNANGEEVQAVMKAPVAGVMYYWWDGLEKIFSTSILGSSDIEKVFSAAVSKNLGETVQMGENVAKVVDNLEGIYCVAKYTSSALKITPSMDQKLIVSFAGFRTSAIVKDYKKNANLTYLLMQLSDLPTAFDHSRRGSCVLIPQKFTGVVLPKEAIVPQNEAIGVYVLGTQKNTWQQVSVIGETGDKIVVEGLSPTQEVITNPEWVKNDELTN